MAASIGIRGSRTVSDERAFSCICQILRISAYSPEITPVDNGGRKDAAKSTPNIEGERSEGVPERCSGASDGCAEDTP